MATPMRTGLTYADLQRFPDDHLRREIIGGQLFVTPAPAYRHQVVVGWLTTTLTIHAWEHGGTVLPAPFDVFFADDSVVEPDVVVVRPQHAHRIERRFVRSAPDLVVEVSSPSTRRRDLGRKRDLYEREGVEEYWFVDLDRDRLEVYRLAEGRYGQPRLIGRGGTYASPQLPGLEVDVDALLGPAEDG